MRGWGAIIWARLSVEVEGPFFAETEAEVESTGLDGDVTWDGSDITSIYLGGGRLTLRDEDYGESTYESFGEEVVSLGTIRGVPIHCKSNTCMARVLRHRPHVPPPMVAKVVHVWNGGGRYPPTFLVFTPAARFREAWGRRSSNFDYGDPPAPIRCPRCQATGRVVSATELTLRVERVRIGQVRR